MPLNNDDDDYSRSSKNGKGQRSDSDFLWSLTCDKELKEWQTSFKAFLETKIKAYNLYKQAMNNFLDYLICYPSTTRIIKKYIAVSYSIDVSFHSYLENIRQHASNSQGLKNNLTKMYDFFEWYLINNCIDESGTTPFLNNLDFKNPITKITIKVNKTETMRNALPSRYLKMLEEIITENDFYWPKQFKNDWVNINNKKVWSPVLTYLLLLKLKLPMRTYQLRYLDSGESDKYVFDYSTWSWISNTHIASQDNIQRGVLKRIIDNNTNKEFVGLYINTNKTANMDTDERGYTIPWENKEVIKIISDLVKWQKRYNPIIKPLKWLEIEDIQLKKKSKQQLLDLGENTFLFRDMFNKNPSSPVQEYRIDFYWKKLLAELEKRLSSDNNSQNIKFIEKWVGSKPTKAYYDLHSLRVTNLTALYQSGVPYSILSKYIAGHASIMMTMYYTKFNVTHISSVLNNATKIIEQKEQENFNEFIANNTYSNLKDNIAFNSNSSMEAISQLNRGNYMTSDIGICPVGENKCSEGGELLSSDKASHKIYAPVEGGAKNCLRCRFFITGVPFLLGLTSRFNELSISIKEKVIIFRQAEEEYELLYSLRYEKEKDNEPFLKWKDLEIADSNYNKHNNELDQILINWQYLYSLIEQCLAIKDKENQKNTDKFCLVTNGNLSDLNTQLVECSDFELYDTVCQSSIFYKSIEPNISNLKRGRIINKMLMYNKLEPSFLLLDDKESLEIGNEFVKLLMIKLGKPNTLDVINEKKKLSDFGISLELEKDIKKLLNNKYEYNNKKIIKATDESN